ncbi:MAG TPA: Uma2 family endonuclease [Allocoleopsis sp.]
MQLLTKKLSFTVTQYHQMGEIGIIKPEDRVELIRGEIIKMSPIGIKHASCVRRLDALLSEKLGKRVIVDTQNPVQLDNFSQPQPDVVLLKYRDDFYNKKHPQSDDVLLLIEVADTTIETDRNDKIPLYAEMNIIEVWLVDINQECIEVYRNPSLTGYQQIETFLPGQNISIESFSDIIINVSEIF